MSYGTCQLLLQVFVVVVCPGFLGLFATLLVSLTSLCCSESEDSRDLNL